MHRISALVAGLGLLAAMPSAFGCSGVAGGSPSASGDGIYRYTWTRSVLPEVDGADALLRSVERKIWVAANGAGRIATRQSAPMPMLDAGVQWSASAPGQWAVEDYGASDLTYLSLDDLETSESGTGSAASESGPGSLTPGQLFQWIRDRLHETVPSKSVVVALIAALDNIEGVRSGPTVDKLGRSGTAYEITTGLRERITTRLAITEDFGLLEETRTLLDRANGWPAPPAVLMFTQYVDSRMVGSISEP